MNIQSPTRTVIVEPTDDELLEAVTLGNAMWSQSPVYKDMDRDIDKMIEFAYNSRANSRSFFRVAVRDDLVIGFLIAERAPYGFHDSEFAYDRLLYVQPNRRGGVAASMLIDALEDWCKEHNVSRILLGVTTGVHSERTVQLYNHLGYTTVGTVTMKEL